MWTIFLLVISNVFMTFAWYGHLKYKGVLLWKVILISWMIAFFEYCFQVPANRLGEQRYHFNGAQLKIIQEVITLVVFAFFSVFYLGNRFRWNHAASFVCIVLAVTFVFAFRESSQERALEQPMAEQIENRPDAEAGNASP